MHSPLTKQEDKIILNIIFSFALRQGKESIIVIFQ